MGRWFSKEPLISILGETNKYITENFNEDSEVKDKLMKVKDLGVKVFKRGIPKFIKSSTLGVLDINEGYEEAIGSILESSAKFILEHLE